MTQFVPIWSIICGYGCGEEVYYITLNIVQERKKFFCSLFVIVYLDETWSYPVYFSMNIQEVPKYFFIISAETLLIKLVIASLTMFINDELLINDAFLTIQN